ncbi:MAG: type II/IV secretion system ATPase subunit [Chloroflexi bacterium]|jgi:archaeal flagellar protein FlaI|nr:type II/IV secretion system ATPase subunit [Chloroflexota bacterium]
MPELLLPFEPIAVTESTEELLAGGLYAMLPEDLQAAARENTYLLEYLHMLPIEEIGVPKFHKKLARSLSDEKNPNIIYPTQGGVFVHLYPMPHNDRHLYIPIEPILTINMDTIMPRIEERLLDYTKEFDSLQTDDEMKQAFITVLDKMCKVKHKKRINGSNGGSPAVNGSNGSAGNGKSGGFMGKLTSMMPGKNGGSGTIELTPEELAAVKYLTLREKVGVGLLDPLLGDIYVEDVSCSGIGQIFIEHKIFKSVITAINIPTMEELDDFARRMSERMRRPVTLNEPIQDATLPDGSRINIVYGEDVSRRGTNFTIRRAMGTPTSIMEICGFGTMTYQMAAYLSLVLEENMNVFVAGETASGKTTTINAISVFMPPTIKIVSIEDTPELVIPHKNWLREVSRESKDGKGAQVGMFDLLRAALRQRPNMIIIGEIRGAEGLIAFQAMQTGHGVMATFHASSVEKLIQRLTGDPINVPKNYVDCLNCVIIQSAVKLPNGKEARRVLSISEIIGYDSVSQSFSFIHSFQWNQAKDEFEFPGHMNSFLLEEKIAPMRGLPPEKKRNIYNEMNRRARILERLHKEKGVTDFYELLDVLSTARKEGVF